MEILNDLNFTTKTANGNIVVDFYADWCGPCKMISPLLEEINQERNDVTIVKVDTGESAVISRKFNIRSLPTMVFLKNGIEIDRFSGAVPKTIINQYIDKIFS
jgi:thioredoxin 1